VRYSGFLPQFLSLAFFQQTVSTFSFALSVLATLGENSGGPPGAGGRVLPRTPPHKLRLVAEARLRTGHRVQPL